MNIFVLFKYHCNNYFIFEEEKRFYQNRINYYKYFVIAPFSLNTYDVFDESIIFID